MKKYCYAINNWLIDLPSGSIIHLVTGEHKRLGAYQLKLLDLLQQHPGKVFTREELTNQVWEGRVIGNNSLPNAIHALRAALEDDGKQQRIIRTVPKRGYILDAEYCQQVESPQEDISLDNEKSLAEAETANTLPHASDVAHETGVQPMRYRRGAIVSLLLIVALLVAFIGYLKIARGQSIRPEELAKNEYSNIRLYTLIKPGEHLQDQATVYNRLKDTYHLLNEQIKKQSINLNIYSRSDKQTLNFTLRLYSTCGQNILAMQIYHWRANLASLNELILEETRRKLDEMVPCKTA
ncbi:winged helix-turn-helix domain-containing protein [Kosakonia pseudosacchari]|uniref:winged helix-turn-helix domain-containing protein n=1 Tax=Kosakonia pseudosacchari TaxID=1646340 RepID=UPI00187E16AF|nr:winged helix-turn-helix domain-containing protein [Kosakonia pseudosacchari]QOV64649.1 winged helix-turn-helix domain-containing protein [Kosakonia pseudosacchari]